MKTTLIIVVACLVGLAAGSGAAVYRMQSNRWNGEGADRVRPAAAPEPDLGLARASVDAEEYKFGVMDAGDERSHDFIFTNKGTGPLTLTAGSTSCRCTVATLDADAIEPGKSTKVTLKWRSKGVLGIYKQTARVLTNDPGRPEITLTIVGEITMAVRSDPEELIFSSLFQGGGSHGEVRLWCNLPGPALAILDYKLSDQATAKYIDVSYEPISAEALKAEKEAKSGVLIRVTVKPGLPSGPFQQTILIRTNLESAAAITVPIRGTVASEITVAGPGWDTDSGFLNLGAVSSRSGAQRRLLLIVRGSQSKEVKFKPVRMIPDFLHVTLGKTTPIGDGTATQTPLFIEIPVGSPTANHLGSEQGKLGRIILETGLTRVPQFRVPVRFAIEEE